MRYSNTTSTRQPKRNREQFRLVRPCTSQGFSLKKINQLLQNKYISPKRRQLNTQAYMPFQQKQKTTKVPRKLTRNPSIDYSCRKMVNQQIKNLMNYSKMMVTQDIPSGDLVNQKRESIFKPYLKQEHFEILPYTIKRNNHTINIQSGKEYQGSIQSWKNAQTEDRFSILFDKQWDI